MCSVFLKMFGTSCLAMLIVLALATTGYVPSSVIAEAASSTGQAMRSRIETASALKPCSGGRNRIYVRPDALHDTVMKLRSWQNDEGFLATTEISCRLDKPCEVRASALIPATGRMTGCWNTAPFLGQPR
jgi:hypothetical protein